MLKRLRSAHPMLYCLGAEVLFLGILFVASMVSLLGILFVLRDLEMADDYLLTTLQEAAGILTAPPPGQRLLQRPAGGTVPHRTHQLQRL